MKRFFAFCLWIPLYGWELLKANYALVKTLLFVPNEDLDPAFFAVDVEGLSRFEIFLLSHLITLTPGTTSADLVDDGRALVIHGLDLRDTEAVRRDIETRLKEPLLRWTRS